MTLWDANPRTYIRIKGFMEDMPEAYRLRLHDLGFRQNAEVYCLRHAPFSGPRVFQVEDAVFALEKTVAVFVKVEPVEHE